MDQRQLPEDFKEFINFLNENKDDLIKNKKALFLTTDKDFFHTLHFTQKPHYGIIVIALSQPNSKNIIE